MYAVICSCKVFILNVCLLTAKGAIQKEVVYFGLSKQEVVLLQRPTGEDKNLLIAAVMHVKHFDRHYV